MTAPHVLQWGILRWDFDVEHRYDTQAQCSVQRHSRYFWTIKIMTRLLVLVTPDS